MSDAKSKSAPPERKQKFSTLSGLPLDPLYTEESLGAWDPDVALGYPGEFPYTRGIYPTMYRGRFWTMRQYAGFGTAVESNRRYRYLLGRGQAGLSV
ncbi:MAG TPA: methylmalonyl-CoA mutase family protein, partial [Candidatus Acidoferrum sp.]